MTNAQSGTKTRRATISLVLTSAIVMAVSGTAFAQSNGERKGRPFDRAFLAATTSPEVLEAKATAESSSSDPVEILRTTFDVRPRFSRDLVLRLDSECGAILDADEEETVEIPNVTGATVRVWAEVDGSPVPVAPTGNPETEDDGSVVQR